ncbi:MAG: FtsX-like permease family protein [bacterium]
MRLLRLAWRNVFRHRRRTVITFVAISVGLAAMILMDSMLGGFEVWTLRSLIAMETGHVKLHGTGYREEERNLPVNIVVADPDAVSARLAEAGYERVTPRTVFATEIGTGTDQLPIMGIGIDLATDSRVFEYPEALVRGRWPQGRGEMLVGQELAKDLAVDTGGYVTLVVRTRAESWNALDFTVVGLLGTGSMLVDANAAVIALEDADELLVMNGAVTEVAVRLARREDAPAAREQIAGLGLDGVEGWTWRELGQDVLDISGTKGAVAGMVMLVVVIIAAVGIVNTMLMAVMERTREIGTMRALGFGYRQVMALFLFEGGFIGTFGSLLGTALGIAATWIFAALKIDMTEMVAGMSGAGVTMPVRMYLHAELDWAVVVQVLVFGVLVSLAATLLPARRAARVQPADALRKV